MRAAIRSIDLDPDPRQLPADPAEFLLLARRYVVPSDGPGEESFDVEVCTPEWLAQRCTTEVFDNGSHKFITTIDTFSETALRLALTRLVENASGTTWHEVAEKLARFGLCEFEDYSAKVAVGSGRKRHSGRCDRTCQYRPAHLASR